MPFTAVGIYLSRGIVLLCAVLCVDIIGYAYVVWHVLFLKALKETAAGSPRPVQLRIEKITQSPGLRWRVAPETLPLSCSGLGTEEACYRCSSANKQFPASHLRKYY